MYRRIVSLVVAACAIATVVPSDSWAQPQTQQPAQRTTRPPAVQRPPRQVVAPRIDPRIIQRAAQPGSGHYILRNLDYTVDGGNAVPGFTEPPLTYWHEAERWSVVYMTGTVHAGGIQLEHSGGLMRDGADSQLFVRFHLEDIFPNRPQQCTAQFDSRSSIQNGLSATKVAYAAIARLETGHDAGCWRYFQNLDTVSLNPPQVSVSGNPSETLSLAGSPRSVSYGTAQPRVPEGSDRGSGKMIVGTRIDVDVPGGTAIANLQDNGQPSGQDIFSSIIRITGSVNGLNAPIPDSDAVASYYRVEFDPNAVAQSLPMPLMANCRLRQSAFPQSNVQSGSTTPRRYVTYLIFSDTLVYGACWQSFRALAGQPLALGQSVTLTAMWQDNGLQQSSFSVDLPAPVTVQLGEILPREDGD